MCYLTNIYIYTCIYIYIYREREREEREREREREREKEGFRIAVKFLGNTVGDGRFNYLQGCFALNLALISLGKE